MEREHAAVAREGEKALFAALYRAHVHEVYRYLHRRCRDSELAEDLTHDVFMSVVTTARPVADIDTGWLITAARHRLIDVMRRRDRYDAKLVLLRGGLADLDESEPIDRIRVEQALEQLSLDHRLVLSLHYLDGMKVSELADHLGRTVKSAEGLLTRARRALRRELKSSDA